MKNIQIRFGVPIICRPIKTLVILPFIAITKLLLIATMLANTISMSVCATISNVSLVIIKKEKSFKKVYKKVYVKSFPRPPGVRD